ncbi:MAG TPA: sugar kinase [Planctomycetaceae bacterium]|nr:sugar kinase [Planctomycetaceae bacterium]
MTAPVICFGELLLRLDAPRYERLVQAATLSPTFTGGEANVAVALLQWGQPAAIVSKVPAHELGQACVNQFRRYGVDTQHVQRGGDRLGVFFVETGASQRGSKVIYDRQHSSFRTLDPAEFDWATILDNAAWFHFSGTAPALGGNVRQALADALSAAKSRRIPVSFDCSYRSTLWSIDEARRVLPPLLEFVDVYFGSESDLPTFFDVTVPGRNGISAFQQRYGIDTVALTDRTVTETGVNRYWGLLARGDEVVESRAYDIDVVDRIGAGDAFAAGVIRGLLRGDPLPASVEFATAAAVLKHSIPGDFALVSIAEIAASAANATTGRVQR